MIITSENRIPLNDVGELVIPEGVTGVGTFAYEDERRMVSASFPLSLVSIGAHAFYNCRSLCKIRLGNCDTDIGDGAFKNCERLREIEIVKRGVGLKCLRAILFDAHREVRVRCIYPDGEAVLIFPYYIDNFEENTPARIVMHIPEGAGSMYRECIHSGDIDYKAYDALFKAGMYADIYDSSAWIALYRLHFPYRLGAAARAVYEDFIKANVASFFDVLAERGRADEIRLLLSLDVVEEGAISELVERERSRARPEVMSVLLDCYKGCTQGRRGGRYEF